MIAAKVAVCADAIRSRPETAGEVETFYNNEGCQAFDKMRKWIVGQKLKQRNLSLKAKSQPFKLSEEETTRRLGAFWRNSVRCLCFFGKGVGAPFTGA